MCPRRKEQVDWKIGVKHCPCGQSNHLDEDYCVSCGFPFGDNPVRRRPRPWRFRSWAAFAVLMGLLTTPIILGITGWRPSARLNTATYQSTQQNLTSRVLTLERKVRRLEEEVRTQGIALNKLTAGPTTGPTPAPTPDVQINPVPAGSVLVVQVERGNVRSGPGTSHPVIGTVTAGQIIEDVLSQHDNGWYRFCCVDGNKPGWLAGSLVALRNKSDVLQQEKARAEAAQYGFVPPTQPPQALSADPYYKKHLNAGGVAVLAPESVSDEEMYQTGAVIFSMLSSRPDLLAIMLERGFRVGIYNPSEGDIRQLPEFQDYDSSRRAAAAFRHKKYGSIVGIPERIHDCNPGLLHEFAHAIDYTLRWRDYDLQTQSPNRWFKEQLETTYQNAMAAGLWQGQNLSEEQKYTAVNKVEYWAQTVEYWLRPQAFTGLFGVPTLAHYDPGAAQLIESILGDISLPDFCQIASFEVRGKLTDTDGKPVSGVSFSLMMWQGRGSKTYPLGQIDRINRDGITGQDGTFVIHYNIQKSLLEQVDEEGIYFTLGVYREFDRTQECSVAGYVSNNKLVNRLWKAQSIEIDGQDLSGLSIRAPRTFTWEPEVSCS